ncbi:unnamed protein product [Protopolystoma xenopodis]|uniref:Uncharacterized protein n=1 Tax=Protopolystoma xenopodis TaxID=117903 RepID=A0A3S5CPQ1_9PLAT|nr:unnamed protein product [Protopolystoma xenopodis]
MGPRRVGHKSDRDHDHANVLTTKVGHQFVTNNRISGQLESLAQHESSLLQLQLPLSSAMDKSNKCQAIMGKGSLDLEGPCFHGKDSSIYPSNSADSFTVMFPDFLAVCDKSQQPSNFGTMPAAFYGSLISPSTTVTPKISSPVATSTDANFSSLLLHKSCDERQVHTCGGNLISKEINYEKHQQNVLQPSSSISPISATSILNAPTNLTKCPLSSISTSSSSTVSILNHAIQNSHYFPEGSRKPPSQPLPSSCVPFDANKDPVGGFYLCSSTNVSIFFTLQHM